MRKVSFLIGVLILFVVFSAASADEPVPGQIMIDIKHEYLPISPVPTEQGIMITGIASVDSLNALYQVHSFEKITDDSWSATKGFYVLRFPDSLDVDLVHSSYSTDIHIHLAGLTGFRYPDVTPGDYYFPQQWGLSKMKCPEAWRHTNGSSSIIIQIIDGGTDYGHPDLVHNIWQNLGEDADGDGHTIEWDPAQNKWVLDPGDVNGSDGDGNYYCDDLVGFDFRDPPCGTGYGFDPQPTPPEPPLWLWGDHGDKTAGTAAAVTDNRISLDEANWICYYDTNSVAGTSWFSKIMIARVGDPPEQTDEQAVKAIHYARNNGAKIINMSWSGLIDDQALHAALDSAYAEGLLLVASAGAQSDSIRLYPAAYPNVIAVAGTESNDVKATNSNYGTWVDICAPYRNVAPDRADSPNFDYYCYDTCFAGTSASAPFVAGVAAMVWTCNLNATNAEVRAALEDSADA
ncbi:MAG: S8 family serine peptidase, partial [Candidatus Zixiibacteriota bacterium]